MNNTLVLVHKKPQLGIGKQRLAAQFGTELTLQIAEALLACAIEDTTMWPGPVVFSPANEKDCHWARQLADQLHFPSQVVAQIKGNLGQRLNALDKTLRDQGMERLIYIGSDAPSLTEQDYAAARSHLNQNDVALMPAADGGVVLMANRRSWPDLTGLPWSTDCLGAALTNKCRAEKMSVSILNENFDIDKPEDFLRLAQWLKTDRRPARRALHKLADQIAASINISLDRINA